MRLGSDFTQLMGLVWSAVLPAQRPGNRPVQPDYGSGKPVPGLLPGPQCRLGSGSGSLRLKVGDRVFMAHLRGGVLVRILQTDPAGLVLGRVVAIKGLLRDTFIDEVVQVPPECVEKVLGAE